VTASRDAGRGVGSRMASPACGGLVGAHVALLLGHLVRDMFVVFAPRWCMTIWDLCNKCLNL
jgi:hypothetical protein